MIDYLEQERTINGTFYADMPGNPKKEARTTDLWCSALAYVTGCHDSCD